MLRPQPVGALEIFPGMGHHLLVGGMVDRLDADDLLGPGRIMGLQMLDQLSLGQPGPTISTSPASAIDAATW